MIKGHITRDEMILAYASIARSPDATAADKEEAVSMVMLLMDAADYFFDRHGNKVMRLKEAIRERTAELGPDHPEVIRLRIARDHRNFVESLLEGKH